MRSSFRVHPNQPRRVHYEILLTGIIPAFNAEDEV
jgi:hypothetical protein